MPTSAGCTGEWSDRRTLTRPRFLVMALAVGLSLSCDLYTLCPSAVAELKEAESAPPQVTKKTESGTVEVTGEVRNPGLLQMTSDEQLTLSKAILNAGGLGPWGVGSKVILKRLKNGVTETTIINYESIVRNHAPDPVLVVGDRIFVPKGGPTF